MHCGWGSNSTILFTVCFGTWFALQLYAPGSRVRMIAVCGQPVGVRPPPGNPQQKKIPCRGVRSPREPEPVQVGLTPAAAAGLLQPQHQGSKKHPKRIQWCASSVISVNGWHELFELHSYRCNIDLI
jgi:hypothetical protein